MIAKKDFNIIASTLRKQKPPKPDPNAHIVVFMYQAGEWDNWNQMVIGLANRFESEYPKFQYNTFLAACELELP